MAAQADIIRSRRSFLGVIASAYLLNAAGRVADVIWLLVLFTVLPVEQVAIFALASAVAAFFAMGLDAGLNQTLLREFSARRLSLEGGVSVAAKARAALLTIGVLGGSIWWVVARPQAQVAATVAMACAVQLWIVVEQFCYQWLRANDRQTLANALTASEPFLKLAAAGVLVLGTADVTALGFFAIQNVYHCFLAVACVLACVRSRGPESRTVGTASMPLLLRASGWFALMGLITVAQNRIDWLLVAHFTSATATASYSLVNRAYEVLMMLIGTGAMTLFPILCRAGDPAHDGAGIAAFRKAVLAAGVLAAGAAALLLPGFCVWIWQDKYPGADTLFAMLMPVACLSTFIQAMYYEAIAKRAESRLVTLGIVSTLAQLVVNVTLIPRLGPVGAVAGMLALAVTNIALYFRQRTRLGLPPLADMRRLIVYAGGMAVLWPTLAFTVPTLWMQVLVGGIAWAAVTFVGLLERSERRAITSWIATVAR